MTNEPEAPVDDPTESQLAELVRAAAGVVVPEGLRAAVAGADRPEAGPRAGELWRARRPGAGPVITVWLRSVGPAGAEAVPVSFDTEYADDDTVLLEAGASPLGLPLALHRAAATTLEPHSLLDRLGSVDPAAIEAGEATRAQAAASATDAAEADVFAAEADQEWWPVDTGTTRAELFKALHLALGESHPGARISPRPAATAGSEQLDAVALVAELDAFVLVALVRDRLSDEARLEAARQALHADQLLNAVCLAEAEAPFLSVVVDRRDVVAAIETPSGRLRPPRQSRPAAAVGTALSKFLDATISPFGRLASTFVEGQALDPRALAVDVSADAVRTVHGSAKGFKTEGKRPGYERVKRHQAAITRLVEAALNQPGVDVAAILDEAIPGSSQEDEQA
jgi:hypothetical protein